MTLEDQGIIPVRADEHLDLSRLEPYLRAHLPGAEGPVRVRQFSGGHANLTYLIEFDGAEYVLRRPPLGPIPAGAHDMAREHRVLSRLHEAFPLAPRSYVYCEDTSVIGAPFFVMERRRGFVIHSDMPEGLRDQPDLNRRIGEMLVDTLAALHRVEPEAVGLGDLGNPRGFAERQLVGWVRRWRNAGGESYPGAERIVAWLEGGRPGDTAVGLVHNDYKLNNLILSEADPAVAVAVIDWDMCTRGDPLFDLGYMLNYWLEPSDDPAWRSAATMPTWRPGFPSRDAAIQRYAAGTGRDVEGIDWYHVFGIFKLMGILQQIYFRYQRGQTADERFAVFGDRIHGLIDKASAIIA